jgi:hypothetical protein
MARPSNGITQEVIQDLMPDFILGADLLRGIMAAIPLPPDHATPAWRHDRCARIIEEAAAFLPADAAQGRLAAQIIILRDMADDTFHRTHAAGLSLVQVCRARRTADRLSCSAERMERALTRRQQKPTPSWGNVAADALDVAALDAEWGEPASCGAVPDEGVTTAEARPDAAEVVDVAPIEASQEPVEALRRKIRRRGLRTSSGTLTRPRRPT